MKKKPGPYFVEARGAPNRPPTSTGNRGTFSPPTRIRGEAGAGGLRRPQNPFPGRRGTRDISSRPGSGRWRRRSPGRRPGLPDRFQHALHRSPVEIPWSISGWPGATGSSILGLPIVIADGLAGGDYGEAAGRGGRVSSAKIAGAILGADALLALSHVTGHVQTGLGAALKNLGMGCASRTGKLDQHAVVHPRVNKKSCRNCGLCLAHCPAGAIRQGTEAVDIDGSRCTGCGECLVACRYGAIRIRWDDDSLRIQEKIAEYALLVARRFPGKTAFLNFLIQVTKDCDCMARNQPPIVPDIGLLASTDPVAVDRASVDLILARSGGTDVFRKGYDIDWSRQLAMPRTSAWG